MNTIETVSQTTRERWRMVRRFADVLDREVKAKKKPLVARVTSWFNLCRICQDLEEELLLSEEKVNEDQLLHRAFLSVCIGAGETLYLDCGDSSALQPLGISADSIQAQLESLRITFEQWHTEIDPEHQKAVLMEVFGVPA